MADEGQTGVFCVMGAVRPRSSREQAMNRLPTPLEHQLLEAARRMQAGSGPMDIGRLRRTMTWPGNQFDDALARLFEEGWLLHIGGVGCEESDRWAMTYAGLDALRWIEASEPIVFSGDARWMQDDQRHAALAAAGIG